MRNNSDVKSRMEAGINNGEWFEIVYHGGSNPGAKRRIAPIAVIGDKLRARCYASNAVKPFFLAKIEILETGNDSSNFEEWSAVPKIEAIPSIVDVRDVHRIFGAELENKGWIVNLTEDDEGWELSLTGYFKNGKLRSSPSHTLAYHHTASDASYEYNHQPVSVRVNIRPRVRPWSSRMGTFKQASKPVLGFLKDAGLNDDEISTALLLTGHRI